MSHANEAVGHVLNPPQAEILEMGLLHTGFNSVLQLPTGAGKTWLAEVAIDQALASGRKAIYLTPLRAQAQELLDRWSTRFPGHKVGAYTGDTREAHTVPMDEAEVLVMTPERLDACTRHWRSHWAWLPDVALLVVDEFHLLGDPGRGPRLEGTISRTCRLNPFIQVLALSATLGNRRELADWLGGVHYQSTWRPIPLSWRVVPFRKATDKPQLCLEAVKACLEEGGQSLVFVVSRRRAEQVSAFLQEQGIPTGHHHAGLEKAERNRIEQGFRNGSLKALVSTGTLEMGVNVPARQVVLYDLTRFDGSDFVPLAVNTVWQRAGRAGRPGLDPSGEAVLLVPAWDRKAPAAYLAGTFEPILSGLKDPRALAEQVLAEVGSGLAFRRPQLVRAFGGSLAAKQKRLPDLDKAIQSMVAAGMLKETPDEHGGLPLLKATKLGRIAVRQMLSPDTVQLLAGHLTGDAPQDLTFFDLLLFSALTEDCEPRIPVDMEELDALGDLLAAEPSRILRGTHAEVLARVPCQGKRLLAALKTALVARAWTRLGDPARVGEALGCYPYEVRRLAESLERILTAAVAILAPEPTPEEEGQKAEGAGENAPPPQPQTPDLPERVKALLGMISHGLDEEAVTLTFVEGIGGTLARRLAEAGFTDIESLADSEAADIGAIRGISEKRADQFINEAGEVMKTRSAFSLSERDLSGTTVQAGWPKGVDPYRLRRALDLTVAQDRKGWTVTGGADPHQVVTQDGTLACDCPDHALGNTCKHLLAVRKHMKDQEIVSLSERLAESKDDADSLDLFQLWNGGSR